MVGSFVKYPKDRDFPDKLWQLERAVRLFAFLEPKIKVQALTVILNLNLNEARRAIDSLKLPKLGLAISKLPLHIGWVQSGNVFTSFSSLGNKVTALDKRFSVLNTKVTALDNKVTAQVAALDDEVTAQVAALDNKVTALDSSIRELILEMRFSGKMK